ncbi:hypothetical protein D3C85_1818680 [compost metagenome]
MAAKQMAMKPNSGPPSVDTNSPAAAINRLMHSQACWVNHLPAITANEYMATMAINQGTEFSRPT